MAEEEDLEQQLENQLLEQRDSLLGIDQALIGDPHNAELSTVREELVAALKVAEEGLFQLKRTRLLRQADCMIESITETESKDVGDEPLEEGKTKSDNAKGHGFLVGSKCRFRHTDGRWYNGQVIDFEGGVARVLFLTPTSDSMQICKFYMQQRCRFGNNCRMSHGIVLPIRSLKRYIPMEWSDALAGSKILASDAENGIWKHAELESWDAELQRGRVVFVHDGKHIELGIESLSLSEYAEASDVGDSDYTSSDVSDSSDEADVDVDDDADSSNHKMSFCNLKGTEWGPQTETVTFAKWEKHTRGIASKMMLSMGYREGMGLGKSEQGIVDPIQVRVLPKNQSLGYTGEVLQRNDDALKKKKSRGGKRKRGKKIAANFHEANDNDESQNAVFSLINNQLTMQRESEQCHETMKRFDNSESKNQHDNRKGSKESRRALLAYEDQIKDLKIRVQKLEEMAMRNRREKKIFEAVSLKLQEARKELEEAEAKHDSAFNAVQNKEREKKWLKF